ncbi:unnamed protein product [Phytophthora fragariaefolia]|uniref:Unnamed protein product n=1 Tax=Phytophthora fragariaefolia TaxID=1490495 RepID=A0A9W6XV64_9STRA|nr:unnamed protein product [Phytophthora fragariaefolia]
MPLAVPSLHRRLIKIWEATQVELVGGYSPERVSDLAQYSRQTSLFHVIAVIFLTPLPGLVVTVAIDALPLADPSEGLSANKSFWFREYYTFLVITFLATEQFRYSLPILPYPLKHAIASTAVVAGLSVGLMYCLAHFIGFPLPFSILFVTPPWLSFIVFFLAVEWAKAIRETPGAGTMLINVIKLWMCQVLMVFIYPPYYFIFTILPPSGQTAFSMLLPVIKLVMRNIFFRTVVHLSDELPEVITFNIEIFNALFISYCMQNSPSFGTTLMMTAALLVQLAMSLRDVHEATVRIEHVERQLSEERQYGDPRYLIFKSSTGARKLSALQNADTLLVGEAPRLGFNRLSSKRVRTASNLQQVILAESSSQNNMNTVEDRVVKFESGSSLQLQPLGARIQPAPDPIKPEFVKQKRASQEISATSLKYVLEVRRLMYLTEFLVLIYYVGVFIPLIFCEYIPEKFIFQPSDSNS